MTSLVERSSSDELTRHDYTWAPLALALSSLALLAVGLVGLATADAGMSATGLFLYALVGFGSAPLMLRGHKGGDLLSLSPPLGLAFALLLGTLLVTTGTWTIGPVVFWVLVSGSTCVHLAVLTRGLIGARPRYVPLHSTRHLRRAEGRVSLRGDSRVERRRRLLTPITGTTAVALLLCLASAFAIRHLDPGWGGLLAAISPAWYVGLALLAAAIVVGQRRGSVYAGVPVVGLQLALSLTPAIVYDDPRFPWTAKQVGVVSYILLHGSVNPKIDISQAWPGFFSGVAWLCKVSDLTSPMGVARWWPAVIDLAILLVFRQLASEVLRDPRRAWLAGALLVVGNVIVDEDYFSPQSAGYLLAIAMFALVFRQRDDESRMSPARWVLLFMFSIAAALSHQLTPYMVSGALIVLVIFGRVRTRWAPAITLAPALAWAVVHFSYVTQYFSLNKVGDVAQNLLTPGAARGGPAQGVLVQVNKYFVGGDALLIGLIAVAVLFRYRTSLHVAIALCAASGGALIVANSYGNEADFRVVLFALPWLAILAADCEPVSRRLSGLFWSLVLPVLLAAYLVADMGLDYAYAERPGDIVALQEFEWHAVPGSTLIVIGGDSPLYVTGRYNLVQEESYPYVQGFTTSSEHSAAVSYKQFMSFLDVDNARSYRSYYVLIGQEPAAYVAVYNIATLEQYKAFSAQFATSSEWRVVLRTGTDELYRLVGS